MSAPSNYQIVFDETTNNMGRFTAMANTALDKVESYNLHIKICEVKKKQVTQIASNLTNTIDFTSTQAVDEVGRATRISFEIEDIVSERQKLENERKNVLDSVDQAIVCLTEQRDIADSLVTQMEGENHWYELYLDALIAVARWNVGIAQLKARRDLLGQNA